MILRPALLLLAALLLAACGHDHAHGGGDDHPVKGPHGGSLIEVGDHLAHLEFLHDEEAGTITFHALGQDSKTALALDSLELKLNLDGGNRAFEMTASEDGTSFSVTDEALKMHGPEGRITVVLEGKTYNPDLLHDHAH